MAHLLLMGAGLMAMVVKVHDTSHDVAKQCCLDVLPFGLYLSLSVVVNTKLKVGQSRKVLLCLLLVFFFSLKGSVVLRHLAWSSGDLIHGYGQVHSTSSDGMFLEEIWCHAWGPEVSDLKQGALFPTSLVAAKNCFDVFLTPRQCFRPPAFFRPPVVL
jgi:hypothetical protein